MSIKMNPEAKAKWLDALESDEFTQAADSLRVTLADGGEGHCCLGVMCEVFRRATGRGEWDGQQFVITADGGDDVGIGILPNAVAVWAGLSDRNPSFTVNGRYRAAAEHNDGAYDFTPVSFKEIAAAVREQL